MNFGRVKPSFMIIGVQKGGTTSLHKYLLQHPQLIAPKIKELRFFNKIYNFDINKYEKNFPIRFFSKQLSFESTPSYLYHPLAAKRIFEYNPKLKFIVLLRNPVERAYSAWNMFLKHAQFPEKINRFKEIEERESSNKLYDFFYRNDFPSFETWIEYEIHHIKDYHNIIEPSIIRRGYYKNQIEKWYTYFSEEQFLFIDSMDLKHQSLLMLNTIADFLGIDRFDGLKLNLSPRHKNKYVESIKPETYQYLMKHYQEKNQGLDKLIELKLDWLNS